MQSIKPIDSRSMHQEFQDRVKEYILGNKLRPGDPLPTEAQLAEQLGVSRAVVREGLRSLESLGMIYSRRGEGRFVSSFSFDPILQNLSYSMLFDAHDAWQVLDVRRRLELSYISDALATIDEDTLEEMRALVAQIRRNAEAGKLFTEEDIAFHRALYRRIDNRVLTKLLEIFWEVYNNLRDRSLLQVPNLQSEAQNHEQLLEAVEARDVDLTRKRLQDHFGNIEARLKSAVEK